METYAFDIQMPAIGGKEPVVLMTCTFTSKDDVEARAIAESMKDVALFYVERNNPNVPAFEQSELRKGAIVIT